MSTHLLTFEVSEEGEQLFVHADPEGLRILSSTLNQLVAHAVTSPQTHLHLMTESWGGDELTEEPQASDTRLIHKVTLYAWPSGGEPKT